MTRTNDLKSKYTLNWDGFSERVGGDFQTRAVTTGYVYNQKCYNDGFCAICLLKYSHI
jgi:hypothetical protein